MEKIIDIFIGGFINKDMIENYRIFANDLGNLINNSDCKIIFDLL